MILVSMQAASRSSPHVFGSLRPAVRRAAPLLFARSVFTRAQRETLQSQWQVFQSKEGGSLLAIPSDTSIVRALVARLPLGLRGVLYAKGPSGFKNFFPEDKGDSTKDKAESSGGSNEGGPKMEKKQRPKKKKKGEEEEGNAWTDHIGKVGIVLALLIPFALRGGPTGDQPILPFLPLPCARSSPCLCLQSSHHLRGVRL